MATLRLQKGLLDLESGTIGGTTVRLSPTERALVHWLAAATEPADPDTLLTEVWGYREGVRSRTVYATIDRVRKKLEVDPAAPVHLVTVEGGYRLVPAPPRAVPEGFVGRADALDVLEALLDAGGAVGIHGPGGVGKTRLAEVGCALLAGRFREQVAVELRGVGDVDAALEQLGRALSLRGAEPARLRAALGAREPVLVVLDDLDALEDRAGQLVEALAPSAARTVLVTSRQVVSGTVPVPLAPLSPWASRSLLARLSRAEIDDPELERLATHLDHLPLALELVAPWLGRVPVQQLLDRRAGLGALDACIARSWDRLAPPLQGWLAELARWGGRIPVDLALELAPGAGLDALAELERESLVAVADGQVRLLETVRAFAAARAGAAPDPGVRAWAQRRCRESAAVLAGPGHAAGVAAVRDALPVLLRIVAASPRDERWSDTVLDLAAVLDRLGPTRELERWLAEVEAAAGTADQVTRCRAARAHLARTRGQSALERLGPVPGDDVAPEVAAAWWVQQGLALHQEGDVDGALAAFQRVLDADLGNHVEARRAWFGIARVHRGRHDLDQAEGALRTLEGLARIAGDPLHGMAAQATRAQLARSRGALMEAEVFARGARELAAVLDEPINGAHLDKVLGTLAGMQERPHESSRLLKAALATYQRHGLLESEGFVRLAQGADALWAGQRGACEEALLAAEEAFARSGHERARSAIDGLRGRLLASEGELEAALEAFGDAASHGTPSSTAASALWTFTEICRRLLGQPARAERGHEVPEVLRSLLAEASDPSRRTAVLARLRDPALDRAGLGL